MNGVYFPSGVYPNENNLNSINNLDDKEDNCFQSIIDVLNNNKKKKATIYCAFPNNSNKSFEGIIEDIHNNMIIINEPVSGKWVIIMMKYLNYIEFEEELDISQ